MLQVKSIVVGVVGTNCYIVYDKKSRDAVIIDPGAEAERILSFLEEEELHPKAILLTHGHFDHILAVPALREKYKIPLYAAEEERTMLGNGQLNMSGRDPEDNVEIQDFTALRDGEELEFLGKKWKVLSTPGHTRGSICFFVEGEVPYLFSGSEKEIIRSIRKKLFTLPEETLVFPGHEESTTIRNEKSYNPVNFFRE